MTPSLEPAGEASDLRDEERQPCEIWTRVMGYHRPVSSFNRGKQGEHQERVAFRFASETACVETV
jgi:anaerobic ribonucleoside-triphosphate reductase-like protein